MRLLSLLLLPCLLLPSSTARAQATAPRAHDFRKSTLVEIGNGLNQVDIDADGRTDLVVVAYRENYNAHGFDYVTLYRLTDEAPAWQLVPFYDKDDKPVLTSFSTHDGADCRLRDLRLVRPAPVGSSPVAVIVGERAFGDSYIAPGIVTFTLYRAVRNAEHDIGAPAFYFRAAETFTSQARYCDVGEAFDTELGIRRSAGR